MRKLVGRCLEGPEDAVRMGSFVEGCGGAADLKEFAEHYTYC